MPRYAPSEYKEVMVDDFFAFAGEDMVAGVSFAAFLAMSLIFLVILAV